MYCLKSQFYQFKKTATETAHHVHTPLKIDALYKLDPKPFWEAYGLSYGGSTAVALVSKCKLIESAFLSKV